MSRDLTIATMFHPQDRYQKEIPQKYGQTVEYY